ncbi:M43 family zinc metalloprotease [Ascidiimonas sp. W6]|uniref:M43 family zinc metalloprotease n=1 Tax=Ascidiimonas meishanensis TaxID=3128903 RepID=UPI0030EF79CD
MKIKTFLILLLSLLPICKSNGQDEKIVIKTVFHFVHNNFTEENIPDNSVKYVLQKVNEGFNSVNKELIADEYKDRVASCNIFFELATTDINGKTIDPISWHLTDKKSFTPYLNDKALKKNGYIDSSKYLNIWVCNISADLAGGYTASKLFSNIPPELDGVVIDINEFTKETSYYLVSHEIGHWFGLNHIWGKTATNSIVHSCMDDDDIFDTPQQKSPNILTKIPELSCDGFIYSNHQNFMDYSYDVGMFTNGQKDYMRNYIKEKRSGLIKSKNDPLLPSVLSTTKQRDKFGTRMIVNNLYPYGTITDRDMVELFNSIGIIPTSENLQKLGLKIIANDKFKDLGTGKEVNQDYIYKYLDVEKVKNRKKDFQTYQTNQSFSEPKYFINGTLETMPLSTLSNVNLRMKENYFKSINKNFIIKSDFLGKIEILINNIPVIRDELDLVGLFSCNLNKGKYKIRVIGKKYDHWNKAKEILIKEFEFKHLVDSSSQTVIYLDTRENHNIYRLKN